MVDPNVSRRNLLVTGGAVLALSACHGQVTAGAGDDGDSGSRGYGPNKGEDPNEGFPMEGTPPSPVPFKPDFITLVRISSGGAWDISANHASFATAETDFEKRKKIAKEIFFHFKGTFPRGNKKISRLGEIHGQSKDYGIKQRTNKKYDADDFANFDFGHPHEIYIWIDDPDATLLTRSKDGNKPLLIEMTAYRADGTSTAINKSFYAEPYEKQASIIPPDRLKGPIFVVRNYFHDESGNTIGSATKPLYYSMNIYFMAKNKQGKDMVIILDPDTGNGNGIDPIIIG